MAVKTLKVDLPAEIFDAQASVPLLHQVVVAQLAAARQGTHKTKNRGEVSGAGRKPFKQKGTGNARQGSIRAPHMTGGGVVHGPTPRNYAQRTPKKMIAAALRGALSDRARHDRVHVVENFISGETPSTKAAKAAFAAITERKNILLVIARAEDVVALSARNLENVHVLYADQLNTYDVLVSDDVVSPRQHSTHSLLQLRRRRALSNERFHQVCVRRDHRPRRIRKELQPDRRR